MKVKIYIINKNQKSQYYGLMNTEKEPLPFTPTWKTEAGAKRYAVKHGYELVK